MTLSTTPPHQDGRPAPDAGRWPDVATVPACSDARAAIARWILRRALAGLPLSARLGTDAAPLGTGGPRMDVADPEALTRRIAVGGLIGFGESYMAGEWDSDDLAAVLEILARHIDRLVPRPLQRARGPWAPRHPAGHHNTPDAARRNVQHHYDLSNELFACFLDDTLTYSAAVFDRLPAAWSDLPAAQHRKVDRLLDLAAVGPGTRLLEIGTGWGELALRAAARGATVTTLTLSREQHTLAVRRVAQAGQTDRVTVDLCDYREATGVYDAIVSVEMIEAIGAAYWPEYFAVLDRRLAPGGRIALQAITMPHERMRATLSTYTWIQKYIFPGGMIPSLRSIQETAHGHTSLRLTETHGFGRHYAQTLRLWRERFTARTAAVEALGFDETFRRMWDLYLAYSEAGFSSGYLDVQQLLLTRGETR